MSQQEVLLTKPLTEQLQTFTWVVRKEKNWLGQAGYMITLKGMEDCFSYGDSYQEAKKGLEEAAILWTTKEKVYDFPKGPNKTHLVVVLPEMSDEEMEQINLAVSEWG